MAGPDSTGKEKTRRQEPLDYSLVLVVLILVGFGLVVLIQHQRLERSGEVRG